MTPASALDWPHLFFAGDPAAPVFLMLHGTGGDESTIVPLGTALDPAAGVLAPRGQVTENGANRWFRRFGEGKFDVDDVVRRAGELAEFIVWARGHYFLGERRIIAVGFSNGANIALAAALLHPLEVPELIAFSGMYPFDDRPIDTDLSGSRVFLAGGDSDPMAPLPSVIRVARVLGERGADLRHVLRAGGHAVAAGDLAAAKKWLAVSR